MAVTLGESGLVALLWVAALSLAEHQTRRGPAGRRCVLKTSDILSQSRDQSRSGRSHPVPRREAAVPQWMSVV